jgi:sugar O-acyltransferase (sialic acid O-acetyltransferase NeuD family)
MSEPLIIIGAGGHGRETAFAYLEGARPDSFLGFLDDQVRGTTLEGWPVLGVIDAAPVHANANFHVAVNDPRSRRIIVQRLAALGVSRWATIVHPDVRLHRSVQLGEGCSVLGGCQVTTNIRIGSHCIINRGAQLSHDCIVGDYCSLNPGACVAGNVSIAAGCQLGSGCLVRQGHRIAAGATIGMGAVVVKDVPEHAVLVGNPGSLLRMGMPW